MKGLMASCRWIAFWVLLAAGEFPAPLVAQEDTSPGANMVRRSVPESIRDAEVRHARALDAARKNRLDEAFQLVSALLREYPDNLRYRYDAIAIASWGGRDREAAEAAGSLRPGEMPPYVLATLARSLRNLGRYEEALSLYVMLGTKSPADPADPLIGQVNTLLDAGRVQEALPLAQNLFRRWPGRNDVRAVLARSYDSAGRWMEALDVSLGVSDPQADSTIQGVQFRALWRLGAVHAAARIAPRDMTVQETASLRQDKLAFELRWARIVAADAGNPARWEPIDRVIQGMGELAAELEVAHAPEIACRVGFDQVTALTDRRKMAEGIAVYNDWVGKGCQAPRHARMALAHALLHEEQPDRASDLFGQLQREDPEMDLEARLAYFYALLESGQYEAAQIYIDSQYPAQGLSRQPGVESPQRRLSPSRRSGRPGAQLYRPPGRRTESSGGSARAGSGQYGYQRWPGSNLPDAGLAPASRGAA